MLIRASLILPFSFWFNLMLQKIFRRKKKHFLTICQVLTKDSVTVSVDAVVYYRVSNATISVANVENAHHSTRYKDALIKSSHTVWRLLAQTTLRNILGTKNLHEILSDRESISCSMQVVIMTFYVVIISWLFIGCSWWCHRALGYQGWASWNVSLTKVNVE